MLCSMEEYIQFRVVVEEAEMSVGERCFIRLGQELGLGVQSE